MTTGAIYLRQPFKEQNTVSTANTNRDGTGTIVTIATGQSTAAESVGKRVNRVTAKATGSTTAGMLRFFESLDGGSTWKFRAELPVDAITVAADTASFYGEIPELVGLVLVDSSHKLGCSTHNAETFHVHVELGGFTSNS